MTDIEIKREFAELHRDIASVRLMVAALNKTLAPIIEEANDWRTFAEAARFFSVKPTTIVNWTKKGGLETRWSPNERAKLVSLNALIRYRDEATSRLRDDLNKKFSERNEKVSQMLDAMREADNED